MVGPYRRIKSVKDLPRDLQYKVKSIKWSRMRPSIPNEQHVHIVSQFAYHVELNDEWTLADGKSKALITNKKVVLSLLTKACKSSLLTPTELDAWLKTCPRQDWFKGHTSKWIGCNSPTVSIVFPVKGG